MLIIYKVVIKKGMINAFKRLASETLIPEARKMAGCKLFSLYQNTEREQEFVFHEVWDNEVIVHTYKQRLISILGDPSPGEEFPAAMNKLIESDADLV